ncbi:MAG: type II secretion system protein [Thermoplasmata archaeon]
MKSGFTLIEILIVLTAIISLLGLFFYFLNPIELFKRNRDFQRINDLKNLELAINAYLLTNPYADLDGNYNSTGYDEAFPSIFVSIPYDKEPIPSTTITDANGKTWNIIQNSSSTLLREINGLGWIPINFTELKTSPITYLPIDPINSYSSGFFYTYAFSRGTKEFELNANLEYSENKYGGKQDKTSKDGGSDNEIYEAGTNKCLMVGNRLYAEITTTTCKQAPILKFPSYPNGASFSCLNPIKITEGQWLLFDAANDNLVPTDTTAVHDGSTSTSLSILTYYVAHKFSRPYFLSYVKVYSSFSAQGNAPYIKYYKNATWTSGVESPYRECYDFTTTSINDVTNAWAVGWGSNAHVCEMEAYGCPFNTEPWIRFFGLDTYPYDVKISDEKFEKYYIVAGGKKINSTTILPWWAKIDVFGNVLLSSTINLQNVTTSIFISVLPVDENGDKYVDHYIFGGFYENTALAVKISSTGLIKWISTSTLENYSSIKSLERTSDGNYIGVGEATSSAYVFKISSSTGQIFNYRVSTSSSICYSPQKLNDIKIFQEGSNVFYLLVGQTLAEGWVGKIDDSGDVLNCLTISNAEALSILPSEIENSYYILVKFKENNNLYYRVIKIKPDSFEILNNEMYNFIPICESFCNLEIRSFANYKNSFYGVGKYNNQGILSISSAKLSTYKLYPSSFLNKIINAIDKDLIIAGYNFSKGGFIMKIDENGNCPNCLSLPYQLNSFSNIFKILQPILQNLRFLP